jgi:hypothetical protein
MDLNEAMSVATSTGLSVRCDATMRFGWTIRYDPKDKLFYYFNPKGEKAHKVHFTDAHRSSFQWRAEEPKEAVSNEPS